MNRQEKKNQTSHLLLRLGVALFLLGLLTGFGIPLMENPRMGLSSHLEGVLNGMFLLMAGLLWPRLELSGGALRTAFWLLIYGTFANWAATLLAAVWGAGAAMPIAAGDHQGTAGQELLITFLLFSLSFAMIAVCSIVLWGLRGAGRTEPAPAQAAVRSLP